MKTVIVLSAPRSGTSMMAGILSLLGVSMGHVRLPDPLNPAGYFEDREFLSLADDVFSAAMPGAHGFNLPSPEALELVRGRFDDRIRDLTTRRMQECSGNIWGWKATGLSLFADDCLRYLGTTSQVRRTIAKFVSSPGAVARRRWEKGRPPSLVQRLIRRSSVLRPC